MISGEVAERPAVEPRLGSRRRLARLSAGHLIMIVAGVLAVVANLALLRSVDTRVPVAVAAHDLPAGAPITPSDLALVRVAAEPAVLGQLLTEQRLSDLQGVAARSLQTGELVTTGDLVEPAGPDRLRAMSIPIDPEHAAGGAIRAGDRVDIVAVREGEARFVLTDAEVLAVAGIGGGPLGAVRDFFVTVAIEGDEVLGLAEALDGSTVQVVLSTGAAPLGVEDGG